MDRIGHGGQKRMGSAVGRHCRRSHSDGVHVARATLCRQTPRPASHTCGRCGGLVALAHAVIKNAIETKNATVS